MHPSYFGGTIRSILMCFALTLSVGFVCAATTSPLVTVILGLLTGALIVISFLPIACHL
jgi:hypothetical protein